MSELKFGSSARPAETPSEVTHGHEKLNSLKLRERYFNELVQGHHLMDEYRARLSKGEIPEEFNWTKNTKYKKDSDAAHDWAENEMAEITKEISTEERATADALAKHLKESHRTAEINKLRDWLKFLNELVQKNKLMDEYRARILRGEIPEEYDWTKSNKYKSDADAANAWLENEFAKTEARLRHLENPEEDRPPTTPEERDKKEKEEVAIPEPITEEICPPNKPAYVVDISEIVRRIARTQAEEKLNEYKNRWKHRSAQPPEAAAPAASRLGRLWGGAKNIAKGIGNTLVDMATHPAEFARSVFVRTSEKAYLNKFYDEALHEIQNNRNLMAEIEARIRKSGSVELSADRAERHFQILDNIVEQYTREVADAEEMGEVVHDPDVDTEVGNLMYEYATGALADRAAFEQRVQDVVVPVLRAKGFRFGGDGAVVDERNTGLMYASNFFELAQGYREYINQRIERYVQEFGPENEQAIRAHVRGTLALDVQLGLKQRDIRETKPDGVKSVFDRFIDRMQEIPVLGKVFATPVAYGAGASVATTLAIRNLANRSLRAVFAAPAVGALFGGFMGAIRRGRDLQYDRGMELRRQALGQEAGGARAAQMREHSYTMRSIDQLLPQLDEIIAKPDTEINEGDRQLLADIYARLGLEKTANVDLFSGQVQEGADLGVRVRSMTELKVRLRSVRNAHPGLAPEEMTPLINELSEAVQNNISSQDAGFKSFRRREMIKAGLFGAVAGVTAGAIAEAVVMGAQGNFSGSSLGRLSEYMHGSGAGHSSETVVMAAAALHEVPVPGTHTTVKLPEGWSMARSGDVLSIIDERTGHAVVNNISVDSSGHFDANTLTSLRNKGWNISENVIPGDNSLARPLVEAPIADMPSAHIQVPQGCEFSKLPDGTYNLIDTANGGKVLASGIAFNTDGGFTPGTEKIFHDLGWGIDSSSVTQSVTETDPEKILAILRQKYGGGAVDPTKRIWHGNADPRSREVTWVTNEYYKGKLIGGAGQNFPYKYTAGAREEIASGISVRQGILDEARAVKVGETVSGRLVEGKELRVNLLDRNSEYVLDFKGLRDMLKMGAKNWDGSYDHKFSQIRHLLRGGKLADVHKQFNFRFYLNDDDFKAGRAFSLPMGPDGAIHIPKGSPLAEILIRVKGGKPSLRLTGETAMYTPKGVAHIFATKKGEELDELVSAFTETKATLKGPVSPDVPSYVINPPETPVNEPSPFIPLPFVPRKDLERGKYPEVTPPHYPYGGYYGYYGETGGGDYGWRSESENIAARSPRLKENSKAVLDEKKEVEDYFKRQDKEHVGHIERLAAKLPVLKKETRVIVCIPAYKEGERIYEALSHFVGQKMRGGKSLPDDAFEIIIFDNHPEKVAMDKTEEEIARFKKDFPKINVHYVHETFPEKKPIGFYRKIVSDIALYRIKELQKKQSTSDHIILSHDADQNGISEEYFDSIIRAFDANRKMDGFGGLIDYPKEAFSKLPILFASKRLWQYVDLIIQTKRNKKSPSLFGPNSGFRASIYAAVGGHNPKCRLAEDLEIGNILKSARNWNPESVRFLAKARLEADPRRAIETMGSGRSIMEQYGDWESNEAIRGKGWREMVKKSGWADFSKARFEQEARKIYSYYRRWEDPKILQDLMNRAALTVGVKFSFSGEELKVSDTSDLERGIEEYKTRKKNTMQVRPSVKR